MTAAARLRAHAAAYPPFAASLEAQGCGRVVGDDPTPAQRLYMDEYETYLRERLEPWRRRLAELEAEAHEERETLW